MVLPIEPFLNHILQLANTNPLNLHWRGPLIPSMIAEPSGGRILFTFQKGSGSSGPLGSGYVRTARTQSALGPRQVEYVLRLTEQLLPAVLDDVLLEFYRLGLVRPPPGATTNFSASVGMVLPERRASTHVRRCPNMTLTSRARISRSSRWRTYARGTPSHPACGNPSHLPCESLLMVVRKLPRVYSLCCPKYAARDHEVVEIQRPQGTSWSLGPHSMGIFVGDQSMSGAVHSACWRA